MKDQNSLGQTLLLLVAAASGCSSSPSSGLGEGGAGGGGASGGNGGDCGRVVLDGFLGSCYQPVNPAACPPWGEGTSCPQGSFGGRTYVGPVGEYLVSSHAFDLGGYGCIYDAATEGVVGSWNGTDTNYYCCGRAAVVYYGVANGDLVREANRQALPCPGSGTGGATGSGGMTGSGGAARSGGA